MNVRHVRLTLALLFLLTVPAAAPVRAADMTVTPALLNETVPLGTTRTVTVTVSNTSSAPLSPQLYPTRAPTPMVASAARAVLPHQASAVDPQLQTRLANKPQARERFVVVLRDQADLAAAYRVSDWNARGALVVDLLRTHADQTQAELRRQLRNAGMTFTPLWIVNALLVDGTLADATRLAARTEVAFVRANHIIALDPNTGPTANATNQICSPDAPANPICWNIRKIGADRVWNEYGVTGAGITVANIDTGVSFQHPALAQQYAGYRAPGLYDHNYHWFDPQRLLPMPTDASGHGTHTMGTVVGFGDGTNDRPGVGVAPGAQWVAAQGCEETYCSDADLIAAAQWTLAPTRLDGTDPRPDLRPVIINNSWAGPGGDTWYASFTAAWRASGMFVVFAAGNVGGVVTQVCKSVGAPGDYSDVVAVGATGVTDRIANFSLLGPTRDGRLKPDLVAPGVYEDIGTRVGILSTAAEGQGYRQLAGTSMAAPHVAGAVALLWSADPTLVGDVDRTLALLRETAVPLSDTRCGDAPEGPNNVYGAGRLDIYAAISRTRVSVPWLRTPETLPAIAPGASAQIPLTLDAALVPGPGTYRARVQLYGTSRTTPIATAEVVMIVPRPTTPLQITGRLLSARTGEPIVGLVGPTGGLALPTDSTGQYTLTLALDPSGSVRISASARSYLPTTQMVATGADQRLDLTLAGDQPQLEMPTSPLSATLAIGKQQQIAIPISNSGTRPLNYIVRVPNERFAVSRSGEPGGPAYSWVELPADAPRVNVSGTLEQSTIPLGIKFPFYSFVITDTTVTPHGMLSFAMPVSYPGTVAGCLPDQSVIFYTLAPFRANLDPARGHLRYGTTPDGTAFVLTYTDVAERGAPPDATSTLQVLLHTDGRITYQYAALANPLPKQLSVGIQRSPNDIISLGCGAQLRLDPGSAVEFRPQVLPAHWLSVNEPTGSVLPGETKNVQLDARWIQPDRSPHTARVLISSSDPLRSTTSREIFLETLPAPYNQRLINVWNRR